jgi:nucleoside-diphosphate-sugar epimerase
MRVLITGAAGRIGQMLIEPLRAAGHLLILTDLHPDESLGIDALDVTDAAATVAACAGASAIVHLGGIPSEAPFADINAVNVVGTYNVLAAAVDTGIDRVILASSNHAVGFYQRSDATREDATREDGGRLVLADPAAPRPDTFYGWSKAAMESLGSLYHDRYGLDVIALRIGTCFPTPPDARSLTTWLSPGDVGRVVHACLTAPNPGFQAIFAVSDNTRRWWSIEGTAALGFVSADDAERFAPELIARDGEPDPSQPVHDRVGGTFCFAPLGETMSPAVRRDRGLAGPAE